MKMGINLAVIINFHVTICGMKFEFFSQGQVFSKELPGLRD